MSRAPVVNLSANFVYSRNEFFNNLQSFYNKQNYGDK